MTHPASGARPDTLTLIAIGCLAYVLAVGLHEHGGHAAACALLGSHPLELGAFYVNCDDTRLTPWAVRWVALAGPVLSALTGVAGFALLARAGADNARALFAWLLGSIGWMEAAGYLLFSGISGLGDLGTGPDGALTGAQPAWLWRAVLVLAGLGAYRVVVRASLARLAARATIGTWPAEQRRMALVCYLAGAATYVLIGAFNPYGWSIMLTSVLPASLGGTSGLLWMFRFPRAAGNGSGWAFERRWSWVVAGFVAALAYAVVFARTVR